MPKLLIFSLLFFCVNAIAWSQTPSPFEVSRQIGNNLSSSMRKVQDDNAIQRILDEVSCTKNPEDIQRAIRKVLSQVSQERQSAVLNYLENRYRELK